MRSHTLRAVTIVLALVTATVVSGSAVPAASADPAWAPADQAALHPGVQMFTDGAQCTANFVFTDGTDVYLGYAAHCASTGAATDTNGCEAATLSLGTPVDVTGASRPGELAYSSWIEMQAAGETDGNACAFNDFALVRIDPADHHLVNPTIPHWGGPSGLNTGGVPAGANVFSYGNSSLQQGLTVVSPKQGVSLGTAGGGWTHPAYTLTPSIPGDSGSAVLDGEGRGSGVVSTLVLAPLVGSNNFSDLASALHYMATHNPAFAGVELVPGTEPFNPNQLPLGGLG